MELAQSIGTLHNSVWFLGLGQSTSNNPVSLKIENELTIAVFITVTLNNTDKACETPGFFLQPNFESNSSTTKKIESMCLPLLEVSGVVGSVTVCKSYKPTASPAFPLTLIVRTLEGGIEGGCEIVALSRPENGNNTF